MPKENTHLHFANRVAEKINDKKLLPIIKNNLNCFYLGSITPDAFYYGKDKSITDISDFFHKENFNPFLFFQKSEDEKDLAFLLGFISHCALDKIFHPIIESLSGDYYDPDPIKRKNSVYLHRHLETCLDKQINNSFFAGDLIEIKSINKLQSIKIISKQFNISDADVYRTYKRFLFYNNLFKNEFLFNVFYLLNKVGILKSKTELALFYGNLKKDATIITDESANINNLFKEAEALAIELSQRVQS